MTRCRRSTSPSRGGWTRVWISTAAAAPAGEPKSCASHDTLARPGSTPQIIAPKSSAAATTPADNIAASTEGPDEGSGFVRAQSVGEALRLVGHPETNLYPCHDDVEMPEGAAVRFERPRRGGQEPRPRR